VTWKRKKQLALKELAIRSINVTMDNYGHLMNTVNRAAASKLGANVLGKDFSGLGSNLVAKTRKGYGEDPVTP